ncbi:TPA: prophage tail fiber N-terminal domain-containing protein [Yersinia enterocolitica]
MSVTVSGIMINPVGEPVVNAQITLTAIANSLTVLNTFAATVRTDNVGAYRLQLEEGSYAITVAANGRSFVYGAVTLDNTTGPSTLNQLLKQQIMESELTPDVILYFRQIQQQVANDLATIKVLESSATDAAESAAHYRDEAKQYAADLDAALAAAKGYRDESGVSAAAAAESAIHAFESESVVIANAKAAALSEANTLQYSNEAQSAADEASTLAAEQTATKINLAVKTDADRAEAAREGAEIAQLAVDTQVGEVNRLHTEVGQLASAAVGSANSAAQSASESESSKNAAAQSEQSALAAAEAAGHSAAAAAGDKTAAKGFRDEAEQFAARAKASAESIDVSALEQQINQKVSQTVFDKAIAGKASNQALADGLGTKLSLLGGAMEGPIVLSGDGTTAQNPASMGQLTGLVGTTRNLIFHVGAQATASLTADEIIVQTSLGGLQYKLSAFNKVINLAMVGLGGMNAGNVPAIGYVAIYAIFNPTTKISGLLAVDCTSIVAPEICGVAMPAGFTASALVSVQRVSGSIFVGGYQQDRTIVCMPVLITSGSNNVTGLAVDLSACCPKNTTFAHIEPTSNYATSSNTSIVVAPVASGGAYGRLRAQNGSAIAICTGWVAVLNRSNTVYLSSGGGGTGVYSSYASGYMF